MPSTFRTYLRQLQRRNSQSVREFAEQLGVDPTHVSRAMGRNSRPFDIYGLFKLARVTGESPSTVLRRAGKGELADLIESFYGDAKPVKSQPLLDVMELWERIEASDDENAIRVLGIVSELLHVAVRRLPPRRQPTTLSRGNGNARPPRARQA